MFDDWYTRTTWRIKHIYDTQTNESCHTYKGNLFICVPWRIHWWRIRLVSSLKLHVSFAKEPYKRDLHSSYWWRIHWWRIHTYDWYTNMTWRIKHIYDTQTSESCHTYKGNSFLCVPSRIYWWLIHTYYVTHQALTWHTDEYVMSRIWMSHVTHMNESCHVGHVTHMNGSWNVGHVRYMNESCHTYEWVISDIWVNHVTHMNGSCHVSHVTHMNGSWHVVMSDNWTSHVTRMNESYHMEHVI